MMVKLMQIKTSDKGMTLENWNEIQVKHTI
jgi:hypothetical protein